MFRFASGLMSMGLVAISAPAFAQVATDVQCTACVGVDDLAAGSVATSEIANGGVRTPDLGANSVTSGKIKNGEVAFDDLSAQVQDFMGASIANITLQSVIGAAPYIAEAECPSDRIPVSSSCACDVGGAGANLGVLFACEISGVGALAGCQIDAVSYDPQLGSPVASVKAICLGATSADGIPWVPVTSALDPNDIGIRQSTDVAVVDVAAWRAAERAAHDSRLAEMKARIARRGRFLQQ